MPRQYLVVISMCLCALFVSFLRCVKHISNTTVIIESDRFDLNFFFFSLSHARLIFFPVQIVLLLHCRNIVMPKNQPVNFIMLLRFS